MPYKHSTDLNANRRAKRAARWLAFGLEPVDDNSQGRLRCRECGALVARQAWQNIRHNSGCPYLYLREGGLVKIKRPQAISLFNLVMGFTKDAEVEVVDQAPSGKLTVRVTNAYGQRGFEILPDGGLPLEVKAMRRASDALRALTADTKSEAATA